MASPTVLLDWSNYVFATMEPVIEQFMSSEFAKKARDLLIELHEQQHDQSTVKRFQSRLRQILKPHAKELRRNVALIIKHPEQLLQDSRTAPEAYIYKQLQQDSPELFIVTEQSKKSRWKSQELVTATAKMQAQKYGVALEEFDGAEQMAQPAIDQMPEAAPDAQLSEQALTQELQFRIRGALMFFARDEMEKALHPAKPILISGTTADEAIAAVAHANTSQRSNLNICIVSDDTDFCQLKQYGVSQLGIKYDLQLTAADMPEHYLKKQGLMGKGRDDLTTYGTVFGPVPDGVECIDAAGTTVLGQHRPGDTLYAEQFAAFDAQLRQQEPWQLDVPELLDWLQQYQHQVPSIRARFLVKMVHHNIDPFSAWSAMPQELQEVCRSTGQQLVGKAAAASAVAASGAPTYAADQLSELEQWLPAGMLSPSRNKAVTAGGTSSNSSRQNSKKKSKRR